MTPEPHPQLPRAPRFALPMSMLYRPEGDSRWRQGRTENISQSGVLFRAAEPMELETPVEMLLDMPAEVGGDAAGASMCRGRVVRRESDRVDPRPALAVAIVGWELVHPFDPRRI
jgi:hypothetical protein